MSPFIANSVTEQISKAITNFISNNSFTLIAIAVLIFTSAIVITSLILLLDRKEKDKRRLYSALGLIVVATILVTTVSPLKEWNTLVTAALLTPIFAYFLNILKEKQKLSSKKDSVVWEYKCRQLQKESDVISELLGELSIHGVAFKSSYPQEIETKRWEKSFKASIISELDTLSIASYYSYVSRYNDLIKKIDPFAEQKGNGINENFKELKDALLKAETLVSFTLTYDLGYLQQNYLVRPSDEFPIHINRLLTSYLVECKIIKKGEKVETKLIAEKVFSPRGSRRFNTKIENEINGVFHYINYLFKSIERAKTA